MRYLQNTRHGQLHLRALGEGGTPLVLLHVTPHSSLVFRRVQPLLAADRLVVAVDRLGFGFSDPVPSPLPLPEYALATLDALDGLGIGQFDVCGIHTGSSEAIELATAHPGRVRRLVLVSVPIWGEREQEAMKAKLTVDAGLSSPVADGSHLTALWKLARDRAEGRVGDWRNENAPGGWDEDILATWVLHHLLAGPTWWQTAKAVADYPTGERLAQVTQPVLVLRVQDRLWEDTGRAPAYLPPQGRYEELPHLDQEAFALAPEEMAARLREFLDQ
jgi:pimeloyl-ACP methyl ester carboxylesterase